jgi:hypothetical protein
MLTLARKSRAEPVAGGTSVPFCDMVLANYVPDTILRGTPPGNHQDYMGMTREDVPMLDLISRLSAKIIVPAEGDSTRTIVVLADIFRALGEHLVNGFQKIRAVWMRDGIAIDEVSGRMIAIGQRFDATQGSSKANLAVLQDFIRYLLCLCKCRPETNLGAVLVFNTVRADILDAKCAKALPNPEVERDPRSYLRWVKDSFTARFRGDSSSAAAQASDALSRGIEAMEAFEEADEDHVDYHFEYDG